MDKINIQNTINLNLKDNDNREIKAWNLRTVFFNLLNELDAAKVENDLSGINLDIWKEKLDITDRRFDKYYTKIQSNNDRDYVLKIDGTALELSKVRPAIYKNVFGNGIDKEFTFTHGIGNDVMVQVLDTQDGTYKTVEVQALDSVRTRVKTTTTPSTNQYKILITEI